MTTLSRTPIDRDDAQEIMEHVNEGHIPELLLCARAFTPVSQPTRAQISAVYVEGVQLEVTDAAGNTSHFVPYSVQDSPHVAIRATVDAALKTRLGLIAQMSAERGIAPLLAGVAASAQQQERTNSAIEELTDTIRKRQPSRELQLPLSPPES